jgi:hypothetical protein
VINAIPSGRTDFLLEESVIPLKPINFRFIGCIRYHNCTKSHRHFRINNWEDFVLKNIKLTILVAVIAEIMAVPSLHAEWTDNGIPLGTAGGGQDSPVISYDGTGGAVIVWVDSRSPVNADIYAQGVTADGTIRWFPIAMPVCTASNYQSNPMMIPDGAGGTIIVWADVRSGSTLDIYVQKLSTIGYIQWPSNGVAICTGQTGLALGGIVSDGAGGAIITWHDRRNFYNGIFAQRIASNGTVMWTTNGVTVCSLIEHQQTPALAPDGSGGAIIAWEDRRNGGYDIYAQRLDASGAPQWTAGGIPICDSGQSQTTPQVVEDGSGGAVIAWSDRRNTLDFDIFAQRVNASGALQWGFGSPVSAWMYDQADCRLIHIGSGETMVTWLDGRSGSSTDVYAQKLNVTGTAQWANNGVAVCAAAGDQDDVRIVPNGSGGAFISWDDERKGTSDIDIYAQNIGSDGTPSWTADGKEICGASGNQIAAAISEDGANGMFVAWADSRSGTAKAYCHRVDAAGNIPSATLLNYYTAETNGRDIRIDWTLSEIDEGVEFHIFRADGQEMEFVEIPAVDLIAEGLAFSFVDRSCQPGASYYYRVTYELGAERNILFEVGPVTTPATVLELHQNLPNPFNPNTNIGYYVPERSRVQLGVFDVKGSMVTVLVDESQAEGTYRVYWNGRYTNGTEAASGVYFYRLTAGKKTLSRKMILLR